MWVICKINRVRIAMRSILRGVFKFLWTFVAFTVHEKTTNWLYADLVR